MRQFIGFTLKENLMDFKVNNNSLFVHRVYHYNKSQPNGPHLRVEMDIVVMD